MRFKVIKKFITLLPTAATVSLVYIPASHAQNSETYLYNIMQNTYGMLQDLNNFPNYLQGLGKFIISWMTNDTSDTTAQMQGSFAALGGTIVSDINAQNGLQLQLTADLYNQTSLGVFTNPQARPPF